MKAGRPGLLGRCAVAEKYTQTEAQFIGVGVGAERGSTSGWDLA